MEQFVKWLSENLPRNTYVNIMAQYRPCYRAFEYPSLARPVSAAEYQQAVSLAHEAGLHRLDRDQLCRMK